MKKILVYGLNNVHGGIEKYLLDIQQFCCDMTFIYMVEQCECIHSAQIESAGGKILYYPGRKPIGGYISWMRDIIRKNRSDCDTLYMNLSDITLDNMIVMLLGLHYKYHVVVHSHAAKAPDIQSAIHRLQHSAVVGVSKLVFKFSKAECLAVSDLAGDYLFSGSPYSIVTPGIEVKKFTFDPQERTAVRDKLGLNDRWVYGFVGRLVKIKNPYYLLDVFQCLCRRQKQNCCLLIVGDGPLREDLEKKAQSMGLSGQVAFIGDTKEPEKYYHAMDYMILPSQSEGLSLVAIEAQAAGLPIACSAGRFPGTIQLTPLVNFVALEDGAEAWAEACIAHGDQFRNDDRTGWNQMVFDSGFETEKAAGSLRRVLCGETEDKTEAV